MAQEKHWVERTGTPSERDRGAEIRNHLDGGSNTQGLPENKDEAFEIINKVRGKLNTLTGSIPWTAEVNSGAIEFSADVKGKMASTGTFTHHNEAAGKLESYIATEFDLAGVGANNTEYRRTSEESPSTLKIRFKNLPQASADLDGAIESIKNHNKGGVGSYVQKKLNELGIQNAPSIKLG